MSLQFVVVYEAPADFQTATNLADRELTDCVQWLDEDHIQNQRSWLSHSADGVPLTWIRTLRVHRSRVGIGTENRTLARCG